MRQVVSISLPATQLNKMRRVAKKRGFASMSAFVQDLFLAEEDTISAKQLLKSATSARAEYRAGKSVKARSLADLL